MELRAITFFVLVEESLRWDNRDMITAMRIASYPHIDEQGRRNMTNEAIRAAGDQAADMIPGDLGYEAVDNLRSLLSH